MAFPEPSTLISGNKPHDPHLEALWSAQKHTGSLFQSQAGKEQPWRNSDVQWACTKNSSWEFSRLTKNQR